jgi:RimJ/RimL family protein N-acetyltransferase
VSAACAEINRAYRNAELSDCGTLKDMAGRGYMRAILSALMKDLQEEGIHALYSIARSESVSMNAVLKNLGFDCTGALIQNVRIFSGFENMNVWSYHN